MWRGWCHAAIVGHLDDYDCDACRYVAVDELLRCHLLANRPGGCACTAPRSGPAAAVRWGGGAGDLLRTPRTCSEFLLNQDGVRAIEAAWLKDLDALEEKAEVACRSCRGGAGVAF